ncbi:hypothetical protein V6Z11_A01G049400 [Gossypium hirsutum]
MLDLKYNYLNDSILLSLSELSSLRYLDLSYNRIEGSSHSRGFQWISRLTKLETLVLSGNSLKNSVLLHMRNLSFLKNLRLSDNHLEGRVLHIQETIWRALYISFSMAPMSTTISTILYQEVCYL